MTTTQAVQPRLFKDLVRLAGTKYFFNEQVTRKVLKAGGVEKWESTEAHWAKCISILEMYAQQVRLAKEQEILLARLNKQAKDYWGLTKEEVRRVIEQQGWIKLDKNKWDEYVSKLRWYWLNKHLHDAQEVLEKKKARLKELIELAAGAKCVWKEDHWEWEGTQEAMDAYWKLEELKREENKQYVRRRMVKID